MNIWLRSQDGKRLISANTIELIEGFGGVTMYANDKVVGKFESLEYAKRVLDDIQFIIEEGFVFDELYKARRTTSETVYQIPLDKEVFLI